MAARDNHQQTVTLRDVAKAAGVHPGTASRALNEQTRSLVNADTAARVLGAAEKLGYRPNPIARGLKTKRSYTIGVLIPDLLNPLFPPIIRGIEDRLDQAGYSAVIANTENDPERERIDVATMRARQVDGLITATGRLDNELLDEIADASVPVVLVNRRIDSAALPSSTADDRLGTKLAVDHLVELGHRRLAFVGGPTDLSTGLQRYESFISSTREHGIEVDADLIRVGRSFTVPEGRRLCDELFETGKSFTGIVAGNDLMALGCYDAMAARRLKCPRDISVTGYNDMPFSDHFNPPMTSIRIPHYEIGLAAADLLLSELEPGDGIPRPRDVLLEPSLVVRGSTAPPREEPARVRGAGAKKRSAARG